MSDNRPMVYRENNRWVFRASSVGRSIRCLVAAMKSYEPLPAPDYLIKAAEAGDRAEHTVKRMLAERGYRLVGTQSEVELPVGKDIIIRGHLDGESIMGNDLVSDHMLEVKSMSENVIRKWSRYGWERFTTYAWQLSVYMHATGKPALYAVYNRDDDGLSLQTVDVPPVGLADIRKHVLLAKIAYDRGDLPECNVTPEYTCPYEYLCDRSEPLFVELEEGSAEVIDHVAGEYRHVGELIKELESRRKTLREELVIALDGRDRVESSRFRVTIVRNTRRSLDEKKLRGELGERLGEFYKETKYEYPRVSEKDGGR